MMKKDHEGEGLLPSLSSLAVPVNFYVRFTRFEKVLRSVALSQHGKPISHDDNKHCRINYTIGKPKLCTPGEYNLHQLR